ncbi:hypothetical protein EPN28_04410 [Patescibacteria group bacterium]|nr:MAG: hypothetical protein EPN28_04410 [Patescibacteria group bacterium]
MLNKKTSLISILVILAAAAPAKAVCPVCAVAVGAGVGLSRWLGVDDAITGLWVGGLLAALTMWTKNWLIKKGKNFKLSGIVFAIVYYGLTIVPLFWMNVIGHPYNTLWGMDKLLLGIIIGSVVFYAGANLYFYLKTKNNGHAHFPFEKIALSVGPLVALSALFYFITR